MKTTTGPDGDRSARYWGMSDEEKVFQEGVEWAAENFATLSPCDLEPYQQSPLIVFTSYEK